MTSIDIHNLNQYGIRFIPSQELQRDGIQINNNLSVVLWKKNIIRPVLLKKCVPSTENLQEVIWAKSLNHCRHVLHVQGVTTDQQGLYLAFEHANGGSLESYISNRNNGNQPLSKKEVAKCCLDIAKGVKEVHDSGFVYGGVRLENFAVFVQEENGVETIKKLKLSWFNVDGETKYEECGVLNGCLAPLGSTSSCNESNFSQSDIFSLGILFYEIATAKKIFYRLQESSTEIDFYEPPTFPPNSTQEIVMLVKQCWERDSSVRPNISTIIDYLEGQLVYGFFFFLDMCYKKGGLFLCY